MPCATGTNAVQIQFGVAINGTSRGDYCDYIQAVYKFSLELGFSLTVLMVVYAGYKYITSAGNQTAINDAKEIIVGALLGFAVLYLISFILSFIGLPNQGIGT